MRSSDVDLYLQLLARSLEYATISAWLWLPVAFAAYCLGRRRLSIRAILVFTAVEAAALANVALMMTWLFR
jgi:hypothetical protein